MQIVLDKLTRTFGAQRAVDEVSFSAGVGITGFLGPNGAGKSTTMRMITGFLEPTAGSIHIDGKPAWPTSPAQRSLIGYLPEHNPLYTQMYIREYLGFIAGIHKLKQPKQAIERVVDLVGLAPEIGKQIGALSKGYRQRVGLAQALIHDPPILILDEPTSGLDPNQLSEIREVIRRMGESKVVLLSTHIMQEVQALCQRVLIINKGKLVADDPIARLQSRLEGEVIVHLTCQRPVVASMVNAIDGIAKSVINGNRARLTVKSAAEIRPALAQLCIDQNWGLLELRQEETSVEDAFQAITQQRIIA
ncbi:MAG: ATP-binding cassette domain-containing protein [Saprospiraceae bacterium]